MRGKADVGAEQLLALVQRPGRAQQALTLFIPQAASSVRNADSKTASGASELMLLQTAVERRQVEWTQLLAAERASRRQRVGDNSKRDVVLAAKMAQGVVKAYAATNAATAKADELADLVAGLDLACVALYVVCALKNTVRLGDLVVDNLLYQVAKKYAEVPKMRETASCVAACVHVRLWDAHVKLCNGLSASDRNKSRLMDLLQNEADTNLAEKVVSKLELLAELPKPDTCHKAQFTRLLLGHTNICITLLSAAQNHEAILMVAEATLSPWIDHLQRTPGNNSKLASSFSDRTFRILWKCAAALDTADQKSSEAISAALRFRSTALSFMLKCSNYTSTYFIQQVHRVGVQHERATRRSPRGLQELIEFYNRSASALAQTFPKSTPVYSSNSLEWEYIQWLEHFALVYEVAAEHLKSAMILEIAVQYAQSFGSSGESVHSCLLLSVAGTLFAAAGSDKREVLPSAWDGSSSTFVERLESASSRIIRDLVHSTAIDQWADQCEKGARVYLKKLEALSPISFAPSSKQLHPGFIPFLTRCLKRSATKVFNYTISVQHSAKYQLYHHVVDSFGEMCKAVKNLRSTSIPSDVNCFETLLLEESRLHRMAVILSVRCFVVDSPKAARPALHTISYRVDLVRKLIDEARIDEKPSDAILQGVLGDLKAIARECYSCATRCYKTGNYRDTVLALLSAFELAESYLEYVMCSNLTAEDIVKAHEHLKVDAIAALLSHCYRELGDIKKARLFTGHSLLYCGDINEKTPHGTVDKYVSCLLEEEKQFGVDPELSLENEFRRFVDDTTHAFKARRICEQQIATLWNSFRSAFERACAKIMIDMRARDCVETGAELCVQLCSTLGSHLDGILMKLSKKATECKPFYDILLNVSQSLAKHKQIYSSYYVKRDFAITAEDLLLVHQSLGAAVEKLQCFEQAVDSDLGGIFGWRGVVAIEIALIKSYGGAGYDHISLSEENAVADMERCLMYWNAGAASGFLFDESHTMSCLEAVCNALSLTSCSVMENTARQLMMTLQFRAPRQDGRLLVVPNPVLWFLDPNDRGIDSVSDRAVSSGGDVRREIELFDKVDKEICTAKRTNLISDSAHACQHLLNALATLGDLKLGMKQRPTASTAKAIGMRELFVHAILSDIHFREGRSNCAISEAKTVLRICWKMVKKFTASSSPANAEYFELPQEISPPEYQQRNSANLLYFMSLECSSWDLLLAAKLSLCRIASLYSWSDQPHRAASYLTEAMRLVGGLNLHLFRRGPFYEYAELELNASHLENAKAAISLLSSNPRSDLLLSEADCGVIGAESSKRNSCAYSDLTFIEQECKEIVQLGDVHLNDGEHQAAAFCYSKALGTLSAVQPSASKVLGIVEARCWRKLTRLQSQNNDATDSTAVEKLLVSMKKLKRAMKACSSHLEQVKCMLELGRINTMVLRSGSPRAFTSMDRTVGLLEKAYLLGDHLGIPNLSQEIRTALGMAYFAEIEESTRGEVDAMDGGARATYLSWASSVLLANAGCVDVAESDSAPSETDVDMSVNEVLTMELEKLTAGPSISQEPESSKRLREIVDAMADNVRQLPDSWVIVSLTIGLSSELVISRFPTNGSLPVSFCLPRVAWSACMREMDSIIQESKELLSGHTAKEACSWDTKQKKTWWSSRELLDKRIEKTVCSMKETLGFWRCLLVKGASTVESPTVRHCWNILTSRKTGPIKLAERNQALLCAIIDAQEYLSDSEVLDGLKHVAAETDVPFTDSMALEALEGLRTQQYDQGSSSSKVPQSAQYSNLSKFSTGQIAKMKVAEVKQLLAAEGLSTDGVKKVLVERLIAAREAALVDKPKSTIHRFRGGKSAEFSTILILNHQLQQFPWEGMDVMGGCSGVTRMPSLDRIMQNAKRSSVVRRDRVRFLLNPAGDLKSTQDQLGPILEGGAATYGWEGVVGETPDPNELRTYLVAADLYIYCGHGSGEAYLHRDKILSLRPDCSAALLFGCSSGRLEREGIFGPSGAVLAYLRAGSPAVLAMLWDVTDRDIDQLSVKVLQEWLLADDEGSPSLAQVLQESRRVCKLKYLNGHAAVCYGLPLYMARS